MKYSAELLDLAVVSVHSMTFVEGVPPSKHFRCITQRYVLRSPITQPNIPWPRFTERVWLRQTSSVAVSRGGVPASATSTAPDQPPHPSGRDAAYYSVWRWVVALACVMAETSFAALLTLVIAATEGSLYRVAMYSQQYNLICSLFSSARLR